MCPFSRTYPLQKPDGHKPPVPRWQLVFPDGVPKIHIAYIGVQSQDEQHKSTPAHEAIHQWITTEKPGGVESFKLIDGNDVKESTIWVCYWLDVAKAETSLLRLSLTKVHASLTPETRSSTGLWLESFPAEISRTETNYSGLDYLPGLARLPGTSTQEHELTAYWGAARDRIPDSAHDLFPAEESEVLDENVSGVGKYLKGSNVRNMVHIRSGQFWQNCSEQESDAYEHKLEPTLEAGMTYLLSNPVDTGTLGLRYLRNISTPAPTSSSSPSTSPTPPLKETCVSAYFTSLDKLESWAKSHKSHLAIYNGAMRHAKLYGDERKFRTWHEVVVLREGEGRFEYLNCREGTGMMGRIKLSEMDS